MKKKLAGKYFFEWLWRSDRHSGLNAKPLSVQIKWKEWARLAYAYGYYYGE